jgi:hypothetical protein
MPSGGTIFTRRATLSLFRSAICTCTVSNGWNPRIVMADGEAWKMGSSTGTIDTVLCV